MKKIRLGLIAILTALFIAATPVLGIEGLKLQIHCPHVVLSWPSTNDETYIVQYRATLDTNSVWQTLTNFMPPASGTNTTFFVHSNRVDCPAGQIFGMMRMGEGGNEPTSLIASSLSVEERLQIKQSREESRLAALYEKCKLEGREPTEWELKNQPPLPPTREEIRAKILAAKEKSAERVSGATLESFEGSGGANGPEPESGGGGGGASEPSCGFYRVVRNGIHLVGITNGMTLSGIVHIQVEVGAEDGNLVNVSVREDGSPVGNSAKGTPFSGLLSVALDTTSMSNGVHQIAAYASWSSFGDEGSGVGTDAESIPITVNVYNEITFPDWMEHYGELYDSVVILAQSAHTNADWYIDVYGGNAGYIGTFGGHTFDGIIEAGWNLVGPPPNFLSYAGEPFFDFVVTTEYAASASGQGNGPEPSGTATAPPKRTYKQTDNWVTKGMWVVANQQAWENTSGSEFLDIATDGFVVIADGAGLTTRPAHPFGEAFRIGYGANVSPSTKDAHWQAMRDAIFHPESRNLFYLGHGSPDAIGTLPNTNRSITASLIATNLHTIPAGQTNRHGYRFVFLYGCETASGTLPESFGIIHRENVPGIDYVNAALTRSAFVGWNQKQAASILSSVFLDNARFVQHFQLEWTLYGRGVKDALDHAKSDYSDVGFIDRSKLKVFGYWDLTVLGGNR